MVTDLGRRNISRMSSELGVENIIVMGHQKCGGVAALLQGAADGPASCCQQWLSLLKPVKAEIDQNFADLDDAAGVDGDVAADFQGVVAGNSV